VAAVLVLVLLAIGTYPGADLVSLVIRLSPPAAIDTPQTETGALAWLHVEHPAGRTAYIADPLGRMVLLHGAIPGGLIDFWYEGAPANSTAPFYRPDATQYVQGQCPANSSVIRVPPLCQKDIRQMAALGFNSLRLPISWSLLEPARGQFDEVYLFRITQVVDWAHQEGLYVIFDLHQDAYSHYVSSASPPRLPGGTVTDLQYDNGAPKWATITDGFPSEVYAGQRELNPAVLEADSNFWYNRDGIQDEYIATVATLARHFQNDSTVVGYSLFNEPWPGWNLPPGWEDLLLFPFYRRVIDAVTGVHDGLPCLTHVFMPAPCGYPDLGVHDRSQLFFLDLGLPREVTDLPTHLGLALSSYPNLVVGLHAYTHGYTPDSIFFNQPPNQASYPWGGYEQTYAAAEREARAINAALMVTEFGNDPKWNKYILANELLEQERHLVGFAFWTWKENCGQGSWGMFDPIDCSSATRGQPKPQSGCLRADREQLLARVYPSASSDSNLTYHYDSDTGAFSLHAKGHVGDLATVVVIPAEVTGDWTVSGAVAGAPVISPSHGGRILTVYPGSGDFSVTVAAAPLASLGCDV
jgi:endoglycosylceramidase